MTRKTCTKNQTIIKHKRISNGSITALFGIILLLSVVIRLAAIDDRLTVNTNAPQVNAAEDQTATLPTFVRIPQINLAKAVKQATSTHYRGYGVFYFTKTTNPQTIILYASESPHLFQDLSRLQQGNSVILLTQDGSLHEYTVDSLFSSSFTSLMQSEEEVLFLTTPTLFNFQNRLVVKAVPSPNQATFSD